MQSKHLLNTIILILLFSSNFFSQNAESLLSSGRQKLINNDIEGAILDFGKAIKLNPADPIAYIERSSAKDEKKDYKGAMADLNKAIELKPNNTYAYIAYTNRALCKSNLGDNRGAVIDYTKSISIDPKNPAAYFGRGSVRFKLGLKEDACLDWSKAGELGDENNDPYEMIKKHCN